MKNIRIKILITIFSMMLPYILSAVEVDKKTAQSVAVSFWQTELKMQSGKYSFDYEAVYDKHKSSQVLLHIFKTSNSFIIVSGDDAIFPILGYSTESSYPQKNQVLSFDWWIDNISASISKAINSRQIADKKVKEAWEFYKKPYKSGSFFKNTQQVLPLLKTYWNQDAGYNYYCPAHIMGPDGKCYAGCVATAMAQVMKFYEFPKRGQGSNSYHHQAFGDISVNFSNETYDYSNMTLTILDTISRNAIAKLIYHAGVSVNMYYTPSGSSSFLYRSQEALYNFFKYKRYISFDYRSSFTDEEWRTMLMDNLDMKYPILYGGQDPQYGGHAWVCDGYQFNDYFHFNWGWGGAGNGFFYLNNLNSGNGNFTSGQNAVYNIVPDSSVYPLCIPNKVYRAQSYTFNDGSFGDNYQNNTNCQWLIKPDSGSYIKLDFLNFNTEQGADILSVYDGETTSAPLLGSFSGQSKPPTLYSTSGAMLLVFTTNSSVTDLGWKVQYSTLYTSIEERSASDNFSLFPNPANNYLQITLPELTRSKTNYSIYNVIGQLVMSSELDANLSSFNINIESLKNGIYTLTLKQNGVISSKKFIVNK
jgi:hypothetical protein